MTAMLCRSMRSFAWKRRLRHLDAERLRLVAARHDAAVVRRQDDGGTAFEGWPEDPFTGDEEVIAIGQSVDAHGRLRTTPATTPPDMGLLAIEGGERTGGQLALDYRDDDGTRAWRT